MFKKFDGKKFLENPSYTFTAPDGYGGKQFMKDGFLLKAYQLEILLRHLAVNQK